MKVSDKFVFKKISEGNSISDILVWKLWIPIGLTEALISSAHNPPQSSPQTW